MTRATNKTVLAARVRELQLYARTLPSLDLKRRHLLVLQTDEARRLEAARRLLEQALDGLSERLPMLAAAAPPELDALAATAGDVLARPPVNEALLGLRLPIADDTLPVPGAGDGRALPHWLRAAHDGVHALAARQRETLLRAERQRCLQAAQRRTLQRINLFELRLMPLARAEIRRIGDFLADEERAAIVRAKRARAALQRGHAEATGARP